MRSDWHPFVLIPTVALVAPAWAENYLTAADAQRLLFPDASGFSEQFVELSDNQRKQIKHLSGLRQRWETQKIWRAEHNGELIGWFLVDDVIGKHEYITYAVGIDTHGAVTGVEIMSYRETHGAEVRAQSWRAHFNGKTLGAPLKLDQDIPNISGATLSCRNITDGVKRLLALHQLLLRHV